MTGLPQHITERRLAALAEAKAKVERLENELAKQREKYIAGADNWRVMQRTTAKLHEANTELTKARLESCNPGYTKKEIERANDLNAFLKDSGWKAGSW